MVSTILPVVLVLVLLSVRRSTRQILWDGVLYPFRRDASDEGHAETAQNNERDLEMSSWVKCSIEQGMFPDEYAVVLDTSDAGSISLFAPEEKVRVEQNLMSVKRLNDGNGSGVLVRLPAQPFEITSQNVRVPRENLVSE